MAKFTDDQNREWVLCLDGGAIERFDQHSDLGFFEAGQVGRQDDLFTRANYMFPLLYECCREQAETANVGYQEFIAGIKSADNYFKALRALEQAITTFFTGEKEVEAAEAAADGEGGSADPPASPGAGESSTG